MITIRSALVRALWRFNVIVMHMKCRSSFSPCVLSRFSHHLPTDGWTALRVTSTLSALHDRASFLSEWRWPAFFLSLIRQRHQTKTNKTLFFFLPPYKLFLNICGHDSSKSTSAQLLPHYRNPFLCGCLLLSNSCHCWDQTPPGEQPGLQRLQVLK